MQANHSRPIVRHQQAIARNIAKLKSAASPSHRSDSRPAFTAGERLAVIEAMKMENILTATQDATVGELLANKGESLAVDQPILRFA